MNVNVKNANRIFYIAENGELFVQFRPNKQDELRSLRSRVAASGARTVYYHEELNSGNSISGFVSRVTHTGVALTDWAIK